MTIILMVSKVRQFNIQGIVMIILFRFRNNTETTKKSVRLLNIRFDLDGRPVANPVYNLFNKNETSSKAGSLY